jgi:hypothetical protein
MFLAMLLVKVAEACCVVAAIERIVLFAVCAVMVLSDATRSIVAARASPACSNAASVLCEAEMLRAVSLATNPVQVVVAADIERAAFLRNNPP